MRTIYRTGAIVGTWLVIMIALTLVISSSISDGKTKIGVNSGDEAIDIILKGIDNKTYTLSSYQGNKPVLVVFFAPWCKPCINEIHELKQLYRKYSEKMEILSINVDPRYNSKMDELKNKYKITYPILLDSNRRISSKYKIFGIPTNILVDKKGVIRYRGHRLPREDYVKKVVE